MQSLQQRLKTELFIYYLLLFIYLFTIWTLGNSLQAAPLTPNWELLPFTDISTSLNRFSRNFTTRRVV